MRIQFVFPPELRSTFNRNYLWEFCKLLTLYVHDFDVVAVVMLTYYVINNAVST